MEEKMNIRRKALSAAIVVGVLATAPLMAADWWKESAPKSTPVDRVVVNHDAHDAYRVNWVDEYIEVMAGATADDSRAVNQAHAVSMAKKTARHLAYEKLAETVAGLRITSDSTYDRELMLDSNLKVSVQAIIRGAIVVSESVEHYPDGSIWAEVVLGVHMKGDKGLGGPTSSWVLARENRKSYIVEPNPDQEEEESAQEEKTTAGTDAEEASATDPKFREKFSGLVVDGRGLGAQPAVFPRVVTESGKVVYGPAMLKQKTLAEKGLVQYASSIEDAKKLERSGKKPLVIKAVGIQGDGKCDLVVSDDAASLIHATLKDGKISKKGAVVFVID
jgi:hypothetical protein